jgi:hypothetical protein
MVEPLTENVERVCCNDKEGVEKKNPPGTVCARGSPPQDEKKYKHYY